MKILPKAYCGSCSGNCRGVVRGWDCAREALHQGSTTKGRDGGRAVHQGSSSKGAVQRHGICTSRAVIMAVQRHGMSTMAVPRGRDSGMEVHQGSSSKGGRYSGMGYAPAGQS
jgi:hypothetical protein